VAEVLERVKGNFRTLAEFFTLEAPEGGWYAVLPLPEGMSDEPVALRLLEEQRLLVHPGYLFDFERDCLVLSLLPEPAQFREAVRRLREGVEGLC
jgi:alanine-synthesizing transaminase